MFMTVTVFSLKKVANNFNGTSKSNMPVTIPYSDNTFRS